MEIVRSTMVGSRLDFAQVCNARNYRVAAEIGTDRATFAREFLDRWGGDMLYCIDPYRRYSEMPWNREPDLMMATLVLLPHARRTRLLRMESSFAADWFKQQGILFDFVYIDASHEYADVRQDILLWWWLLKPLGMLAGHDFDKEHDGVRRAVSDMAESLGVNVQLTTDYNQPFSWFIEKP